MQTAVQRFFQSSLLRIVAFFSLLLSWTIPGRADSSQVQDVDLLFVGYEAGETNIWIQLLSGWDTNLTTAVLTMGTATKLVQDAQLANVTTMDDLKIFCPKDQRDYSFSEKDLSNLDQIRCRCLVTGVFSRQQQQIAEHFAKQGSKVIAVWDNFSCFAQLPPSLTEFSPAVFSRASYVLTPTIECASDLNVLFYFQKAIAVGQPTLDIWEEKIKLVDRGKAFEKIHLSPDLPIVLFIGGYHERGNNYYEAFDLFAKSLLRLQSSVQVLVQLHPRSNGSYEQQILDKLAHEHPNFPRYFISNPTSHLSSFEAVAISSIGVTHRSTLAIQALFAGKSFVHVDVADTTFSSFAIEKGLIPQVTRPVDATRIIDELLLKEPFDLSTIYEKVGMFSEATQRMRTFLESFLFQPSAEENAAVPSNR
ncbi:MAG: hypothetical protein KF898_10565 [Parachlamydiales bacterium]|nr:hypothetical protein [Verrucomicrobiota bacterium]MBX3720079.1 hypothetical protein [Candidatus Acheromyda pituitae]